MRRPIGVAVITIATLLFIAPIAETLIAIAPYRFDDVRWRFGALGLISRGSLEPVLGLSMMLLMASWAQHRVFLRLIGIACVVAAIALGAMGGLFVLDALQARAPLGDAGKEAVAVAALSGTVRFVLTTIALAILAACSWKAARLRGGESNRPIPFFVLRDGAHAREPLQ